MNVLAGLQFENREPAGASDGEEVEDAVLPARMRKDLRINKARIQSGIDAGDVLANEGFEPAFRLRAKKSVARFGRERMTVVFKLLEQVFQSG